MTYRIYIPTRGRARMDLQYTVKALGPESKKRASLVVRPDEVEKYAVVAEKFSIPLVVRPPECDNLSKTLDWIIHVHADPLETCILMDDDLRFSIRNDENEMGNTSLRMADGDDVDRICDDLDDLIGDYPLAGISARFGNNNQTEKYAFAVRQMQVHAVDPKFFRLHGIHPSDVITKSDFHMTLSVLETGHENALICYATVDQAKGSNSEGGVSSYRDINALNAGAQKLKELHPDFVTVVQKTIKWKGINEPFNDVRLAWKQALKFGKAKNV